MYTAGRRCPHLARSIDCGRLCGRPRQNPAGLYCYGDFNIACQTSRAPVKPIRASPPIEKCPVALPPDEMFQRAFALLQAGRMIASDISVAEITVIGALMSLAII